MSPLLKNIRFYALLATFIFSLGVYFWVINTFDSDRLQTIRLTQIYSLSALAYLYAALLIGPLTYVWYSIPFRVQIQNSRRAIGVGSFILACLHTYFAFFKQLGGFEGLGFLSDKYMIAITLSATALFILLLLTATSVDWVIAKMKFKRWKLLQRLVYLASIFILIHAMMLGTHFADLSSSIPQIFFWAFAFLMAFELNRIDAFLKKFPRYPQFGLTQLIGGGLIGAFLAFTSIPAGAAPSLGIHALHIQLAKEAQNNTAPSTTTNPALLGDKTKRYTVTFGHPEEVVPNQNATLSFKVNDASSGNKVVLFNTIYEKKIHLVIVDSSLQFFEHVHPEATPDGFSINYTFSKAGVYHLYINFQPVGAIEQQFAFVQEVGDGKAEITSLQPETNLTKQFGQYDVKLAFPQPLQADKLSIGAQKMSFTFTDHSSGQLITNLKPYLASFGHLVMINTQTFDYLHVHPTNLIAPKPDENGGPVVEFLPLGLYGPIKPGIYKVFGQFNPNGNLLVTDFVVKVE